MRIFLKNKILASTVLAAFIIAAVMLMKVHTGQLNIVIIVMDTVRQDHLSLYGYGRATSPNLSRMAKTSRLYYNAHSTGGWTVPAHASLFTGLFPIVHQATQENWKLSGRYNTLAEVLSGNGYETVGIAGNAMLRKGAGFARGFSRYYETWKAPYKITGRKGEKTGEHPALSIFKKTLNTRDNKRPFFTFINLMEPHSPYDSSRQFYNKFISDASIKIEDNKWRLYFTGKRNFSGSEIKHLKELYDAELLYVDYLVGEMIDYLKEKGLWDNTVFIVTSDHGENIGDHKMMDHVFSLYESTIKIPLIIHYPKLFPPGSKDYNPVQLTDIFPTILKITGIGTDKYPSNGKSLLEREEKERIAFSEYYYPKQALKALGKGSENPALARYKRRIRSVILNKIKFIWGSDGRHELYDLLKDPHESKNIIDDAMYIKIKNEIKGRLKGIVDNYSKDRHLYSDSGESEKGKETLDSDTLRELKSLGYIQ